MLGRLSGFAREWLIAYYGGASEVTDISILLVSLPDLMVTIMIGGGFSAAIVPALRKLPSSEASRLFLQLLAICVGGFSLVALAIAMFPAFVIYILSPGLSDGATRTALPLLQMVAAAIPLAALSGVNQAKLVSRERFGFSQAGTLLFNLAIICAILVAGQSAFLYAIVTGVIIGVLVRVWFQLLGIRRVWVPAARQRVGVSPELFRNLTTTTVFAASIALFLVIGRAFASLSADGGLSLFSYAARLIEVPIGLVFAALATVFLPRISSLYQRGALVETELAIVTVLRLSIFFGMLMTVIVLFFAQEFVDLIFSSTRLTELQRGVLTETLIVGFIFMPLRGIVVLALPILSATEKTQDLLWIAGISLVAIFVVSPFAVSAYGVIGAMLGYGVAHLTGAALFLFALHQRLGKRMLINMFGGFNRWFAGSLLALVAVCWAGARWTEGDLAALTVSAVAGGIACVFLVLGDCDARALFQRIFAKLRGAR